MREFISELVGYASGLLGGRGSPDIAEQAGQATTNSNTNGPDSATRLQLDGSEEVRHGDSRKRPIKVDSSEAGPRKRADTRSEHEKRLMGDYSAPKTAKPITLPKGHDSDEPEEQPRQRGTMHKPGAGRGLRPQNTLNASPHGAVLRNTGPAMFMSAYANRKAIQKPNMNDQPTESAKKRTNIQSTTHSRGDGFEPDELSRDKVSQHPAKRQKLEIVSVESTRPNGAIDLTREEDDIAQVEVVKVNGKPLRNTRKTAPDASATLNHSPSFFQANEFRNIDEMTSTKQPRARRKSRDEPASSQGSVYESGSQSRQVLGLDRQSQEKSTREILDDELKLDQQKSAENERPPINLAGSPMRITAFGPFTEEQAAYNIMRARGDRQTRSPKVRGGKYGKYQTIPYLRGPIPKPRHGVTNQTKMPVDSPDLRDSFIRDVSEPAPEPAPPKLNARKRMKAESRTGGTRVTSIDSDEADELAGETTIGSQASRSASPQKNTEARRGKKPAANATQEAESPSDIRESQFHQSGRRSQVNNLRAGKPVNAEDSYQDMNRVRVQAFYATSRVVTTGDLILQYEERQGQFDLYCNGDLQVVRGEKMPVSISKMEASKIIYSKGSHRVYLKGSRGNVSNGHICIAFLDAGGVRWFMDRLIEVTEDHITVEPATEDRLDKIFALQVSEIQKGNTKYNIQIEKEQASNAAQAKRQVRHEDDEGEEKIKYERFRPSQEIGRRISGSRLSKEVRWLQSLQGLEPSRYFKDDQPRRSSRTSRQIRVPSPSPPRLRKWTQENKIPRWTHSVVYPPEGVRRVTVDFQDLERLDEGEFLNDNIISFALRRIEEKMAPEHREKVYFFNSFFYTALTSKNGRSGFNYDAVKRWTKNNDLLTLPYVVVPINIDLHWFVAIICNLDMVSRKVAGGNDDDEDQRVQEDGDSNYEPRPTQDSGINGKASDMLVEEPSSASPRPDHAPSSPTVTDGVDGKDIQAQTEKAMSELSISQENSKTKAKPTDVAHDDTTADPSALGDVITPKGKLTGTKKSKKRAGPPLKKYDPDQPTIVTLDSFGSSHTTETRNLKDYLRAEAEAKRSIDLDTKALQGMTAKGIPEQTNFCDCGLYLVGYLEEFAKDPKQFITKVLTRQLDKQADFASFDPSQKRDEIRTELLRLYEEQSADRKAKKSAKKTPAKMVANALASSPTPAPSKNSNAQEAPKVAVDGSATSDRAARAMRELQAQPMASEVGLKSSADGGDVEMELSVPRALKQPPVVLTSAKAKASLNTPSAKISPARESLQQADDPASYKGIGKVVGENERADEVPSNEYDDEMLLTADQPNDNQTVRRSNPDQPEAGSDLLDGLENAIHEKSQGLNDSIGFEAADAGRKLASNAKLKRALDAKKARERAQVIDLEPEEDGEPEIPDSQEKQKS